jgi:hypothetical protein
MRVPGRGARYTYVLAQFILITFCTCLPTTAQPTPAKADAKVEGGGSGATQQSPGQLWALKGPMPKWALLHNRSTAFTISTGPVALVGVRVVMSTLQDATTGAQIGPERLRLGTAPTGTAASIDIGPNATQRLYLGLPDTFDVSGTFTGSVTLGMAGRGDTTSFDLTILSTSDGKRKLGMFLIFLGLASSWLAAVGLRQRSERLDALLPAARLADGFRALLTEAGRAKTATGAALDATEKRLQAELDALRPDRLADRGFIPPSIPSSLKAWQEKASEYQDFLTKAGGNLLAMSFLMRDGIAEVVRLWAPGGTAALTAALRSLDGLAPWLATADQAKAAIAPIVASVQPPPPAGVVRAVQPPVAPVLSVRELRIELQRASMLMWSMWAVLTLGVGALALVIPNYAFGIPLDYFKCFFWGFGVQIAGQQLQQLSPTTVTTALGIQLPKA